MIYVGSLLSLRRTRLISNVKNIVLHNTNGMATLVLSYIQRRYNVCLMGNAYLRSGRIKHSWHTNRRSLERARGQQTRGKYNRKVLFGTPDLLQLLEK